MKQQSLKKHFGVMLIWAILFHAMPYAQAALNIQDEIDDAEQLEVIAIGKAQHQEKNNGRGAAVQNKQQDKKKSALYIDNKPATEYLIEPERTPKEKSAIRKAASTKTAQTDTSNNDDKLQQWSEQEFIEKFGETALQSDFMGVDLVKIATQSDDEIRREQEIVKGLQARSHSTLIAIGSSVPEKHQHKGAKREDHLAELSSNPFIALGVALFFITLIILLILIIGNLIRLNSLKIKQKKIKKAQEKQAKQQAKLAQKQQLKKGK